MLTMNAAWLSTTNERWFFAASFCAALALMLLAIRQGGALYRTRFITTMSASLKHNFIVANPQVIFMVSVMLTLALGTVGTMAAGPAVGVGLGIGAALAPR